MRFLTPTEIVHLAEVIHPRYRALVFVGAYGGLRIGELAGLRRGVSICCGAAVTVAEIVTEVKGKLFFGPPKTRAGRRTVGLPPFVVRELQAHLAAQGSPSSHVFTAPERRTAAGPGFPRALLASRPPRQPAWMGLRIHDLRHTAVALWIAAGATPKEVAVRAGHTSVSFTLDRYGHLYPDSDATLRDRLEALHSTVRPADGVVIQLSQ